MYASTVHSASPPSSAGSVLASAPSSSTSANAIESYCAFERNGRSFSNAQVTGRGQPTKTVVPALLHGYRFACATCC